MAELELNKRTQSQLIENTISNVGKVVLGKRDVVEMCVVAMLAGEHILLEDVPGVGKTSLGRALSKSVDGTFARIQFTPDLLPADILGSSIYNRNDGRFEFHPGPIFHNFVLGDEINRAPPRTQAALLEAMSDRQVSIDGETRPLPAPFTVIATQNPFEFEGTYNLPESQLDRFLMRMSVGYPSPEAELDILKNDSDDFSVNKLASVLSIDQVAQLQKSVKSIKVDESLQKYILQIVHKTRNHRDIRVGVSIRGSLQFFHACKALAMIGGRDYVTPDDIKRLAVPTLAHRILLASSGGSSNRQLGEEIVDSLMQDIPVP